MAYLEYFPQEMLQLQEEIKEHPDLMEWLVNTAGHNEDWPTRLGRVAEYVGVILDDAYSQQQVCDMCDAITLLLKNKRSVTVRSGDGSFIQADDVPVVN